MILYSINASSTLKVEHFGFVLTINSISEHYARALELNRDNASPSRCTSNPTLTTHDAAVITIAFPMLCPFSANRCVRWSCLFLCGSSTLRRGQPRAHGIITQAVVDVRRHGSNVIRG
jgi:hypothetical protein